MKEHLFQTLTPNIDGNDALREPQEYGFACIREHFANKNAAREVGIEPLPAAQHRVRREPDLFAAHIWIAMISIISPRLVAAQTQVQQGI